LRKLELQHRLAGGQVRDVEVQSTGLAINGRSLAYSIITDITERVEAERALDIVYELALALAATRDLAAALRQTLEAVLRIDGVGCGGIYLADPASGSLDLALHQGLSAPFIAEVTHIDAGPGRAMLLRDGMPVYRQPVEPAGPGALEVREGLRAVATIPIAHRAWGRVDPAASGLRRQKALHFCEPRREPGHPQP
jgi:hypothetical protein